MNIKKLFFVAMKKSAETWQHSIIQNKSDLKSWLHYEKNIYSKELGLCPELFCLTEMDFVWKYQKRLRKTEYYLNTNKTIRYLLSRVLLIRMSAKLGINVRLNSCGKGLHIVHISSVIISGDIGENYTAFPNTLVGKDPYGRNPRIGNDVTAYAGAMIVGDVQLADHIKIGAGSLVNKSFSEEAITIGGIPAKKLDTTMKEAHGIV